ncbi:MAG: hypothetical protein P1V97_25020 [Planctomycetota bacterium]|nr:hypothetical protein [Planctomycetota bacterium]
MDESATHLLHSLIAMAFADGSIGKREQRFIELVMSEFDVPKSTVLREIQRCQSKKIYPSVPNDPTEKRFLLKMLIKLAAVDAVIDPGERQMLESMSLHCRIDLEELNDLISKELSKIKARASRKHPKPQS